MSVCFIYIYYTYMYLKMCNVFVECIRITHIHNNICPQSAPRRASVNVYVLCVVCVVHLYLGGLVNPKPGGPGSEEWCRDRRSRQPQSRSPWACSAPCSPRCVCVYVCACVRVCACLELSSLERVCARVTDSEPLGLLEEVWWSLRSGYRV